MDTSPGTQRDIEGTEPAEGSKPGHDPVAALLTLLHRYSGQRGTRSIGNGTAGRTRAESEAVIGLFENMLALRTNLSSNLTFRELLGGCATWSCRRRPTRTPL